MTRYFLDTSALVKHYHTELGTDAVDRIIGEAGAELLIARLTLVETISVFAIKVRTGEFDVLEFARLRALFATHIARRRYQVFRLLNVHYVRARELMISSPRIPPPSGVGRSGVPRMLKYRNILD